MTKILFPCQPRKDYKIDTVFADTYYQKIYKTYHTGWDINGKVGGNLDYGDPIYNIYDGVVTEVANGSGSWGLIVRVWHPGLNIYSRSAHLKDAVVKKGQAVERGDLLGHMGTANGRWISHLHWDLMLPVEGTPFDFWKVGLGKDALADLHKHYVDPQKLFTKFGVE